MFGMQMKSLRIIKSLEISLNLRRLESKSTGWSSEGRWWSVHGMTMANNWKLGLAEAKPRASSPASLAVPIILHNVLIRQCDLISITIEGSPFRISSSLYRFKWVRGDRLSPFAFLRGFYSGYLSLPDSSLSLSSPTPPSSFDYGRPTWRTLTVYSAASGRLFSGVSNWGVSLRWWRGGGGGQEAIVGN